MATWQDVVAFKSLLQRKGLVGAVLVAPYSTPALTAITGAGGELVDLTGFETVGKLSADGISVPRDIEIAEQRGWGDTASPSRRDVQSQTLSINFTPIESKRSVFELNDMIDLSSAEADPTSGEVTWDLPEVPELIDRRLLALVRDINKSNGLAIYHGLQLPKTNVSPNGERGLNNDEQGLQYPLSATALMDEEEGTPCRVHWGGPGLAGVLADMGFTAGTP